MSLSSGGERLLDFLKPGWRLELDPPSSGTDNPDSPLIDLLNKIMGDASEHSKTKRSPRDG